MGLFKRKQNWTCATCGEQHAGDAMVFGATAPAVWFAIPEHERVGELGRDNCLLEIGGQRHHFLRGHLELPVADGDGTPFAWTVWVSLSEPNMIALMERWHDPRRADLEPMFGWLSSDLPYEVPTSQLATMVHHREPGLVPLIEIDPTSDHPLGREQRGGITLHRVAEINRRVLSQG